MARSSTVLCGTRVALRRMTRAFLTSLFACRVKLELGLVRLRIGIGLGLG